MYDFSLIPYDQCYLNRSGIGTTFFFVVSLHRLDRRCHYLNLARSLYSFCFPCEWRSSYCEDESYHWDRYILRTSFFVDLILICLDRRQSCKNRRRSWLRSSSVLSVWGRRYRYSRQRTFSFVARWHLRDHLSHYPNLDCTHDFSLILSYLKLQRRRYWTSFDVDHDGPSPYDSGRHPLHLRVQRCLLSFCDATHASVTLHGSSIHPLLDVRGRHRPRVWPGVRLWTRRRYVLLR